jgi:tetratricopeptide (TPR) repeat protein
MTAQILLNRAIPLHQAGKLAEAAELYRQAIATDQRNFHARYLLAALHYQQSRVPEALAQIDAALAINPLAAQAVMLSGLLLKAAGRPQEAVARLAKAVALDSRYAEGWHNLGTILLDLGRVQEAVAAFDRLLPLQPSPEGWTNRGLALMGLGRRQEALASFERALRLNPRFAGALNHRGVLLKDAGRFDEALLSLDQAVGVEPDNETAHYNRGLVLQALERTKEALESYRRAVAIKPDFHAAHYNIGVLLCNLLEDLDGALKHLDLVLAREPGNEKAWTGRAVALSAMGRYGEALESVDKALSIDPDHAPGLSLRATLLLESNRLDESMASFLRHAALTHTADTSEPMAHKLRHDSEQREHLAAKGVALPDALHLGEGAALDGPAINPLNVESATRSWRESKPQVVVIDNLLTEEALSRLRDFCLDSNIWRNSYAPGYLGAMPETGFAVPILAQIAEELRRTFPAIFEDNTLRYLWGFKYDSSLSGIKIHADFAAVNVNFWVTPDEANLDPEHGGLVVWDVSAPLEWNFAQYNADEPAIRDFLARQGARSITVPYRCNRAVIFDSDLFHETDKIRFKPGYPNRRINVTMLYGLRKSSRGG